MTFRNQWTVEEKCLIIELLGIAAVAFSRSRSDYFLAYGTLLGFARTGGILPWDDDADLVVIDGGDLDEIASFIRSRGYTIEYDPAMDLYKLHFLDRAPTSALTHSWPFLDLFILKDHGEFYTNTFFPKLRFFKVDVFPLQKGKFEGLEMSVPSNSENILDLHFLGWKHLAYSRDWNHKLEIREPRVFIMPVKLVYLLAPYPRVMDLLSRISTKAILLRRKLKKFWWCP